MGNRLHPRRTPDGLKVRRGTLWGLWRVAREADAASRQDAAQFSGGLAGFLCSVERFPCWTVDDADGFPVCAFGRIPVPTKPGTWVLWLVGTTRLGSYKRALCTLAPRVLRGWAKGGLLLAAVSGASRPRWLARLGFRPTNQPNTLVWQTPPGTR